MPSVALSVLRPDCSRYIGFFESVATTTPIAADALVISTNLRNLGYDYNDALNGAWVLIEGASQNVRASRLISDYTGSTGAATVRGTNLAVDDPNSNVTVELYPVSPARLLTTMNAVRLENFNEFSLPRRYTIPTLRGQQRTFPLPAGLFQGKPTEIRMRPLSKAGDHSRNLLYNDNADFEAITGWTGSSATNMTTTEVITPANDGDYELPLLTDGNVLHGVTDGAGVATVLNAISTARGRLEGVNIGFEIWIHCLTASRMKARIDEDASTSDSAFHNGLGWELLRVSREITTSPTTVSVGVVDTVNNAALRFYAAHAFAAQGPVEVAEERYSIPAPPWEYIRPYSTDTFGYIRFERRLPADYALEIRGEDFLSSVSAEADTMEIDSQQAQLLYALTAEKIATEELALGHEKTRFLSWAGLLQKARDEIKSLRANYAERGDRIEPLHVNLNWGS